MFFYLGPRALEMLRAPRDLIRHWLYAYHALLEAP